MRVAVLVLIALLPSCSKPASSRTADTPDSFPAPVVKPSPPAKPSERVYQVSEVMAEIRKHVANQLSGQLPFDGKSVLITGRMEQVNSLGIELVLSEPNTSELISCLMDKADIPILSKLKVGDAVTVRGKPRGPHTLVGTVESCRVVMPE